MGNLCLIYDISQKSIYLIRKMCAPSAVWICWWFGTRSRALFPQKNTIFLGGFFLNRDVMPCRKRYIVLPLYPSRGGGYSASVHVGRIFLSSKYPRCSFV